ncbi:MAG: sugar transferase [Chlamydiae bacterium]|nr:sugar transferase [Chlamydiota bacterium]
MSNSNFRKNAHLDKHLICVNAPNKSLFQEFIKRSFDVIFSLLSLLFFSPLLLILLILIKNDSPGALLYKAPRIGKHGKIVYCVKLRTMYENADEKLLNLLKSDPFLKEEYEIFHKLKNDPRITNVGKWLRKSSLDELPQFFNVLKGDLSVVGPRPYAPDELDEILSHGSNAIFSVSPGITGLWQTSGRNLLNFEQRVKLEESYIKNRSFFLDIKLILKTIPLILFPKGAF